MKKIIVFGSFDPLHKGHIDFFKQAKKLGDYLVVVVARDESIKKIKNHKPRAKEQDRLKVVEKISVVDRAILGDREDYGRVLDQQKPDIIAVGYDQKIPAGLKDKLREYKIVTLKPFKPEVFKSSKIIAKE
ncbi:FAD synthase [Candidatus Berkelbacteria bacterium CG10_big_fil_rev_8_21_14_0_10_41_12]|uniref:FAD synthase n=1 Tax=Candidatus Berkelbacteria bacterium CG10_big_fil_rev_8_21_14_0_10_41_12 TaxID=1974513 RepID=A0A2M6WWD7_9BACT|nr:MAG: FAD synthase [Candidatus Berkelbacteria bacterium CG10_big_fil_rev_8_21_14_0_10_41_12]